MNRCPFCNTLEPKEKNKQKRFWERHNVQGVCVKPKAFMPIGIKSVEDEEQNEKTMQVTAAGKLIL